MLLFLTLLATASPTSSEGVTLAVRKHVAPLLEAPLARTAACTLRLDIDRKGRVVEVDTVETCDEPARTAMVAAARQWRFRPWRNARGKKEAVVFHLQMVIRGQDEGDADGEVPRKERVNPSPEPG